MPLADPSRRHLYDIARASIRHGLTHHNERAVDLSDLPPALQELGATFVTLHIDDTLRGCIGTLEAFRPLAQDVSENAFAAAFRDSRFTPLRANEEHNLRIHISLLHPPTLLRCENEASLLQALRPGVDGLILRDGRHLATFLPSVWTQLPQPVEFLHQLKVKAGLAKSHWSTTLRFERYEVEAL